MCDVRSSALTNFIDKGEGERLYHPKNNLYTVYQRRGTSLVTLSHRIHERRSPLQRMLERGD